MAAPTLVREFKIINVYGIHARPAAKFVKTAARFACDIQVEKNGMRVSGKSIMGLLTLEGHQGAVLRISAKGADAEAALQALGELIERRFDED
jgi:phosphocarrier protein